ncbi:MAG: 1-deoxy-D-xylulose-5-phosphate reductoisomerase [Pseudohongiellaceae bacterium]|nr:1-deoxy-D-xylulose-5-phosphate reductoisomerase [Pseudohongiellaceae bacterium]
MGLAQTANRPSRSITILGSTGSIGTSTLDVISLHSQYQVFALTANRNVAMMLEQCLRYTPRYAVMVQESAAQQLSEKLRAAACDTEVLSGPDSLGEVAEHSEVDTVMAAIVGAAGLAPTLKAVQSHKKVLLANKEALVMAGDLFMAELANSHAILLPIDSEHNAVFQCLPPESRLAGGDVNSQGVSRVVLTASGGPFRETPIADLPSVTPEQACKHPNWEMGRKISVDSASMMNKGLEIIEACYMFGIPAQQVDVLIHPQSIVHSMVEYVDGSFLAQMGSPDMRIPIAYSLAWPQRVASGAARLDLSQQAALQFYQPDKERFPCLRLGFEAAAKGGTTPTVLNAANEVAVEAFLTGKSRFTDIPVIIEDVLGQMTCRPAESIDIIRQADEQARNLALELISR